MGPSRLHLLSRTDLNGVYHQRPFTPVIRYSFRKIYTPRAPLTRLWPTFQRAFCNGAPRLRTLWTGFSHLNQ